MRMLNRAALAPLVLLGAACFLISPARSDDRVPVPTKEEIKKAEDLIRELFGKDYRSAKVADRAALVEKLLAQAKETKDDPVARYVLLREARDISAKIGDATTAMQAAEEMAAGYQVGAGAVRAAVAETLAMKATSTTAAGVADVLMTAASAARVGEDMDGEIALLKAAEKAARKSGNIGLVTTASKRLKMADTFKLESEKVKPHLETLKTKPDDAEANLAVGRFLCMFKTDWENGLANLMKGSDEKLKEAAEKDKAAQDGADAEQVTAGDIWYDMAAKADADIKPALQARARHWYATAVENLTGLTKTRVEKRIAELSPKEEVTTVASGGAVHWAAIRKAIANKDVKQWETVGAGFGNFSMPYLEVPPNGAILIGFYYTTVGRGNYPGAFQPIWLTAGGEVKGKAWGTTDASSTLQVTKAKAGYAVGALYTRGGGGFDAIQPIYMKIKDGGLDPTDKYEGAYIGGKGGGAGTFGGDGNFIVGIHGKLDPKKGNVGCLSVISLTVKAGGKD